MEVASSTSAVALRVLGGDEKESLEFGTVKCDRNSYGTRTQE
jgi:hypothetical protein